MQPDRGTDGKLDAAKAAGQLYLDSWQNGDSVGSGAFNDAVAPTMGLQSWLPRQPVAAAIDGVTAVGGTAIGDALRFGWDQLLANGVQTHDWAMVLLSDGEETAGAESFGDVVKALGSANGGGDKAPVIHAVAVGPDADQATMQRAARKSGGTYQYVSVPAAGANAAGASAAGVNAAGASASLQEEFHLNLSGAYRSIAGKVLQGQRTFRQRGPAAANRVSESTIVPIENGSDWLSVSVNWVNGGGIMGDLSLTDPAGVSAPAPLITRNSGSGHAIWFISAPAGGDWTLALNGRQIGDVIDVVPAYEVTVLLHSIVTMHVLMQPPPRMWSRACRLLSWHC